MAILLKQVLSPKSNLCVRAAVCCEQAGVQDVPASSSSRSHRRKIATAPPEDMPDVRSRSTGSSSAFRRPLTDKDRRDAAMAARHDARAHHANSDGHLGWAGWDTRFAKTESLVLTQVSSIDNHQPHHVDGDSPRSNCLSRAATNESPTEERT
jgi:hypothetical protein